MTIDASETKRVFFAIRLSEALAATVAQNTSPLKETLKGRWTKAVDLHVTLKFLGNINTTILNDLIQGAADVAALQQSFSLTLGTLDFFARRGAPHILWLGVKKGTSELEQLAAAIDMRTNTLGFPRENRPYRAHITLGRVRARTEHLQKIIEENSMKIPSEKMHATHIELMESQFSTTPGSPRYICLHSIALKINR